MKSIQNMMPRKSATQKLKHFADTRFQRGVTAVELIIGLAVIGLVVAGVAVTAQSTFRDQKVNDEVQRLQILQGKLRAHMSTSVNTVGINTATAVTGRMVPPDAINGNAIVSKFGSPMAVFSTNSGTPGAVSDAVQIIYSDLDEDECINLAKASSPSFNSITTQARAAAAAAAAVAPVAGIIKFNNQPLNNQTLSNPVATGGCGGGANLVLTMNKN